MQKIHVKSLNQQRYAEAFSVFVNHSLEYSFMRDELIRCTHSYLKPGFKILDVGAGTGHVIQEWVAHSDLKPGHYTAFESNISHYDKLVSAVEGLNIPHDLHNQPYSTETTLENSCDIALFSHSLYWMPDPALAMQQAYAFLNEGGLVLAFIGGPYGVHAMFPLFEPMLERTTPMLQNNSVSSHEVVQGLREKGINPTLAMLPTPIDLTGLFKPQAARELAEFISFCMQLEFSSLPTQLQSDMIEYIRGGCVQQGEKLYWYLPTAAIIVLKD